MSRLYEYFRISRQAHHQQRADRQSQQQREQQLIEQIRDVRLVHPRMGARKLFHLLAPTDIGITAFERLVAREGLGIVRRRSPIRTTLRGQDGHRVSNMTHGLELCQINALWVSDISYLIDGHRVYYLRHLMDVYSRRLLGLSISTTLAANENLELLQQTCQLRQVSPEIRLIHHSDAGAQYTSLEYMRALQKAGFHISIAETCLQNAYSERLNGTIKNEYLFAHVGKNLTQAQWHDRLVDVYRLYNHHRPHQELGYRTPVDFEDYIATIPLNERPVLRLFDFLKTDINCNLDRKDQGTRDT